MAVAWLFAVLRDASAHRLPPFDGIIGVANAGLFGLAFPHPGGETDDPEVVRAIALKMAAMTQKAWGAVGLLPVRFGTLVDGPQALSDLLEKNRADFAARLTMLEDTAEWELRISVDTQPILQDKSARGRDFLLRKREKLQQTSSNSTLFDQINISDTLDGLAIAYHQLPADDPLLRRWVVLTQRGSAGTEERFDAWGALLAQRGLSAKVIGPWPPYHFGAAP